MTARATQEVPVGGGTNDLRAAGIGAEIMLNAAERESMIRKSV
jgi:hypothetical protein